MEFITDYIKSKRVLLTGDNLSGDIDFMHARIITLLPTNEDLKSIFVVKTSIVTADTYGRTVEAENELVLNVYNYEKDLTEIQLYGLFCYATIVNYLHITNDIIGQRIMHNEDFYKPTVLIPEFEEVKPDLLREIKKAYGR